MKNFENMVLLAPMEGVLDALMRDLLTSINCYDLCITEFVRVVDSLVPRHIFNKVCPELSVGAVTSANTPLRMQLLGQNPPWMAENAVRATEMGSHGIDLNFGCPAKTVNKSKGGAVLLKDPERIYQIVCAVRAAVDSRQPVSVKIRLGYDDTSLLEDVVSAIDSAKADMLSVHARTKLQGYKAPAHWQYITKITERLSIPVVANGEIWSYQDAENCKKITGTSNIMLGRGALALPNLANVTKNNEAPMNWQTMKTLIQEYSERELMGDKSFYFSSRLKQWLRYLRLQFPEAEQLFQDIKLMKNKDEILAVVHR
ncbi:tRNA-dihydrouridine synthase [Thalassotalea sp. PLHSN55]|uniref:tRNA-dihydrouridine synthase n=1 Tax=Thalassotalea sp. PLHSN55 TaxID=3435888 RepID=UPI003F84E7C9